MAFDASKHKAMNKTVSEVVMILGVLIFGAGFTALLGHIGKIESLYKFGINDIGMAQNTSVAFLLTGIALFLIGREINHAAKR